MSAFDANLLLGRLGWRPIGVESAAVMLREMDRFHIACGLVSHLTACVHDPEPGNRALFAAVADHTDRLLPVPVVDLNDGGRWRGSVAEWADRGARALRIVPAFYRRRVDGAEAEKLAEAASERGWPVVVTVNTVRSTPWPGGTVTQARDFAHRFPQVPVLCLGANRSQWYDIGPAMEACDNLYLDMSGIETGQALEQLVDSGFGDRLVNGSNYGMSYANVCMERVRCSGLSPARKQAILEDNALRLLGER